MRTRLERLERRNKRRELREYKKTINYFNSINHGYMENSEGKLKRVNFRRIKRKYKKYSTDEFNSWLNLKIGDTKIINEIKYLFDGIDALKAKI